MILRWCVLLKKQTVLSVRFCLLGVTLLMTLFCQDDVANAEPEIDKKTAEMISKGIWMPPGYKVGGFLLIFSSRRCHVFGKLGAYADVCCGTLQEKFGDLAIV